MLLTSLAFSCSEGATGGELGNFPGDGFTDARAVGEQVHQLGGRLIIERFPGTGDDNLAIVAEFVSMMIGFMVRADPVELFEPKRERFEFDVTHPAGLFRNTVFCDVSL